MPDRFCLSQNPNPRWFSRWLPGLLFLTLSLTTVKAADPAPAPSAADMKAVLERLAKLEAEVASLRTQLAEKNAAQPAAAVTGTATAAVPGTAAGTTAAAAKPAEKKTFEVVMAKGVKGTLYGFAQLDAAYDSGKMNNGNLALWVNSDALNSHDSQWILTGNISRLGLDLAGADTDTLKITGKLEMDFLGGGSENSPTLRLRHAYVNALWTETNISLLAGQTWDLNSSLIPPVLNPGLLWYAGNLGMRHPQLRLTKLLKLNETDQIELAVAAARNIGEGNTFAGNDITGTPSANTDPGKDAQMPTIQYRAAYSRPLWVEKMPATVAISGHYGQEEWDVDNLGHDTIAKTYSTSLELSVPVTAKLAFTSELFTGANLDDYAGGIGQGVTKLAGAPNDVKSIKARGGWLALKYQANAKTVLALGVAQDDPNDADLAANTRTRNSVAFINVQRNLTTNLKLGLELSQWETDFKGNDSGDATRLQSVVNYSF